MTEKLKTLMDRAADVDFDAVDLDALVASGERSVRRRRTSLLGGVAALALAAGGLAVVLGGGDAAKDPGPADGLVAPEVSWVVGDTLHTPSASYDLGRRAEAYVRTRVGYAFLVDDGTDGTIYSLVDGKVEQIGGGVSGEVNLVGDENGTFVGWVDRSGKVPAYVTVDLATGRTQRHEDHLDASMSGGEPPRLAWVFAIDDGTAYWLDLRGTVATDLVTGESRVIGGPSETRWVGDVTAGLRVQLVEEAGGADLGTEVVDRSGQVVLPADRGTTLGAISADGRWASGVYDSSVVEIATGTAYPLDIDKDRGSATAYEWLDADTATVLLYDDDSFALLTCEVPQGPCREVTTFDFPLHGGAGGVLLPSSGPVDAFEVTSGDSAATGTEGAQGTG